MAAKSPPPQNMAIAIVGAQFSQRFSSSAPTNVTSQSGVSSVYCCDFMTSLAHFSTLGQYTVSGAPAICLGTYTESSILSSVHSLICSLELYTTSASQLPSKLICMDCYCTASASAHPSTSEPRPTLYNSKCMDYSISTTSGLTTGT